MESKKKLKAIDIPKEALKIFINNSNFIFFTVITSLPLFLFSLYFENRLQKFLLQTSQFLGDHKNKTTPEFPREFSQLDNGFRVRALDSNAHASTLDWSLPLELIRKLSDDLFQELLHLGFLYLVPFNLLQLVSLVAVVDLASKLHREERALTFGDMFGIRFDFERLKRSIVTFLYVALFSTSTIMGLIWLLMTYSCVLTYFSSDDHSFYATSHGLAISVFDTDFVFHLMSLSNLMFLIGIYLAWSSIWNLGLVLSVLEGKNAAKALGSSAYLCLRNLQNGMVLMLLLSLWELGLRVLGFFSVGSERKWVLVFAQSGFFCLGSALKWVGFVVYFEDCLKRLFGKKVDIEEEEQR